MRREIRRIETFARLGRLEFPVLDWGKGGRFSVGLLYKTGIKKSAGWCILALVLVRQVQLLTVTGYGSGLGFGCWSFWGVPKWVP